MKIVLFNWRCRAHPAKGGAEVFTEEILQRWAAYGHDVTLFSSAVDGFDDVSWANGIRHVRRGSRWTVYREAQRWWREIGAHEGIDLVIDEVNTRPFLCHQWVGSTPHIVLMHQLAKDVWNYEMPLPAALVGRHLLEPRWLRSLRYTPVMTVSDSSRESMIAAGLQRIVVVPEGIDDAPVAEVTVKNDRPSVVFVGRMASNKRPDHAVAAVEIARRLVPDLQLDLVGEGPLRQKLAERGDHVIAHGFVSAADKRRIVSKAHVQVVTSVREGWGLIVDEAALLGVPSIGYDVAGLRDSLRAAGGRIVAPRPEALAEALIEDLPDLVATPRRRGWFGGATSWDDVAASVLATAVEHATSTDPAIDLTDRVDPRETTEERVTP